MKRKGICGSQLSHIPHIPSISVFPTYPALCEMCPNTEFFWSVFSCIRTEYGEIRNIFPYPLRMRQNTDQKKLRIWTLFTQCSISLDILHISFSVALSFSEKRGITIAMRYAWYFARKIFFCRLPVSMLHHRNSSILKCHVPAD